jgi:hypothetical protein
LRKQRLSLERDLAHRRARLLQEVAGERDRRAPADYPDEEVLAAGAAAAQQSRSADTPSKTILIVPEASVTRRRPNWR